jgi:protein-S-isoprenylcysteine O-methyltransferase Ste14
MRWKIDVHCLSERRMLRRTGRFVRFVAAAGLVFSLAGCGTGILGRDDVEGDNCSVGSASPFQPSVIPGSAAASRVRIYIFRGLGNTYSLGLDRLASKMNDINLLAGIVPWPTWPSNADEMVAQYAEAPEGFAIVLIGHSYGADDVINTARFLHAQGVPVELLVLLDATSPTTIPSNVSRCVHYYIPTIFGAFWPTIFAGNPVVADSGNAITQIQNIPFTRSNMGPSVGCANHFSIDVNTLAHNLIIQGVLHLVAPDVYPDPWAAAAAEKKPASEERHDMTIEQVPNLGLGVIMACYWIYVGAMVLRVGGKTQRLRNMVVPAQRTERYMMLLWIPLVYAWMSLPVAAALFDPQRFPWLGLPGYVHAHPALTIIRFIALALALGCFGASIYCWRFMGNNWRMAIDPAIERRLIEDGPFAIVRHPIYSLSTLLMLCSVVILPTLPMFTAATVHVSLLLKKIRNEEVFLRERFGPIYSEYCRRAGRLMPRLWSSRSYRRDEAASEKIRAVVRDDEIQSLTGRHAALGETPSVQRAARGVSARSV